MADNVAITAGTGTSIASDDIGGVQYQRVKVTHGADGSATDVSTVSPLPVAAGSALWYEVDVPGVGAAAYVAGEQFGSLITIANAARVSGAGGFINAVLWHDNDDVVGALDVVFFNDTLTLAADNATFSISDADARKAVFVANLAVSQDWALNRYMQLSGISAPYFCTGTSLYAAVITRSAFTVANTTANRIRISLSRD